MKINERFAKAKLKVLSETTNNSCGIGSLAEKMTHKILKYTFEPDDSYHEVEYLGFVADVKRDNDIYEVQTAGFERLSAKLAGFLSECRVTVVHPVIAERYVHRLNTESGEFSKARKSSHRKNVFDAAYDIFKLRDFISESDFSINILLLRVDEYKKEEKKKRYGPSDLIERVPRDIIDSVLLKEKEDYRIFIPQGLPVEFTAKDYLKATRSRSRYAVYGLRLLLFLDLAKCIGNKGRARLYSLT